MAQGMPITEAHSAERALKILCRVEEDICKTTRLLMGEPQNLTS